mmetsp:Transcript_76106/g.209982  ORF Transcript_76106/g.209982 Transcript_76106/m.209982 type:complete len:250 (+) Transcript_76106:994-1743(+)
MLVAPDHQVEEAGQHLLVDAGLGEDAALVALVPVLVQDHDVKPRLRVGGRLEAHLPGLEGAMQPLVPDVPEAVYCQLRAALPQEHRPHDDVLEVLRAAEVVHEAGDLQQVPCAQVAFTARVVMIAVDHKDGNLDVGVGVLVVDHAPGKYRRVAHHLEAHFPGAEAVSAQQVHGPVQAASGWLVVVVEVTTVENEVGLLRPSQLQHLFEGVDRITAAHLVLLIVPDMAVGGNEYAERVIIIVRNFLRHTS